MKRSNSITWMLLTIFALCSANSAYPQIANTKIAFHSDRDGEWEIHATNSHETNQAHLTMDAADDESPAWSPVRRLSPGQTDQWTSIVTNAFGFSGQKTVPEMEVFNGHLYASTSPAGPGQAQLWYSPTGDIGSWTQITSFTPLLAGDISIQSFGTTTLGGGYMWLGTANFLKGGIIYRSQDGVNWTAISKRGFGHPALTAVTPQMVVFQGSADTIPYLYAAMMSHGQGTPGQIWRTPYTNADSLRWNLLIDFASVDPGVQTISYFCVWNNTLYFGTDDTNEGGHLYQTTDGVNFTKNPYVGGGFGDIKNHVISSLAVFKDTLYATTTNRLGGQLWRSGNAINWQQITSNAFGKADSVNELRSLRTSFGKIWVTAYTDTSVSAGTPLWRSDDGTNWIQSNRDGFGNRKNNGENAVTIGFGSYQFFGGPNYVDGGQIWRAYMTAAPAAPILLSPIDGATGESTSPTLSWNSSNGAASYRLQVSTSPGFSSTVFDQSNTTATSQQVSGLANNTAYYWRVNATNVAGTSPYSSAWSFTTTTIWTNIAGTVTYGTGTTPVSSATVTLTPQGGAAMTTTTSTSGAYSFTGITSGTYTLAVTKRGGHPTVCTNAADALRAALYPTSSSAIGTALALAAADVNNDGTVNAADALQIMLRYVGTLTSFAKGDWIFVPTTTTINAGTSNITDNVAAIAVGDVNVDAVPSSGAFFAKADGATQSVVPATGAALRVNSVDMFEVPVRMKAAASIGSMSMAFQYPTESATFVGVRGPEGMVSAANNGVVAVAWFNAENALKLKENDAVVTLRFKPTTNVKDFNLMLDPNSQVSDVKGSMLSGINLEIPAVDASIPTVFALGQNHPNPFNPTTVISYQLPAPSEAQGPAPSGVEGSAFSIVSLKVFDILGREVATLVNDVQGPGPHTVRWVASALPSGVYFYRLNAHRTGNGQTGGFMETKKMVFAK